MSKFPDDELLSAIIDGEANAESIASVEADPEQSQRLANMQTAVEIVAATPPAATPERRSASIAAAMAAATPAAPEITSLAAQRHKREEKKRTVPVSWMAAAAAVLLFVLALPVLFGIGGGQVADTATTEAADESEEVVETAEVAADDASEESMDTQGSVDDDAADEQVADEEAVEEESEALAADDSVDAEEAPQANAADLDSVVVDTQIVQSIEELDDLIVAGAISPVLAGDDLLAREAPVARVSETIDEALATPVNPDCLAAANDETAIAYDIAVLDPFAGAAELVIIEFVNSEVTRVLNAETCEVIR